MVLATVGQVADFAIPGKGLANPSPMREASVVSLIRLYNDLRLVIPAKLVPAKAGSGNPGLEHWIPGQARNDRYRKKFSESDLQSQRH